MLTHLCTPTRKWASLSLNPSVVDVYYRIGLVDGWRHLRIRATCRLLYLRSPLWCDARGAQDVQAVSVVVI